MRAECSAVSSEITGGDDQVVRSLRGEIRQGDERVIKTLREEIRAGEERVIATLREEIRSGDQSVMTQAHVLYEDLKASVALIQESLPPRKRP